MKIDIEKAALSIIDKKIPIHDVSAHYKIDIKLLSKTVMNIRRGRLLSIEEILKNSDIMFNQKNQFPSLSKLSKVTGTNISDILWVIHRFRPTQTIKISLDEIKKLNSFYKNFSHYRSDDKELQDGCF